MNAGWREQVVVIDAPSNLGLRPPALGVVPGVYKLAAALRDQGLVDRLCARDGGVVTPPRYESDWEPGAGVRNGAAIGRYSRRLADRIGAILEEQGFPLVLGGDCSILLGSMLALRRRGRFGLAFVDGHSDFRHPGNAPAVGAAAGEDLALVTGRGDELANLEGRRPLVADQDVVVLGIREDDEAIGELAAAEIASMRAAQIRSRGALHSAQWALSHLGRPEVQGFWIHCDVDVLDAALMPAVDSPEPAGLDFEELSALLRDLLWSASAVGMQITVFDPNLDEDAALAAQLADSVSAAFQPVG